MNKQKLETILLHAFRINNNYTTHIQKHTGTHALIQYKPASERIWKNKDTNPNHFIRRSTAFIVPYGFVYFKSMNVRCDDIISPITCVLAKLFIHNGLKHNTTRHTTQSNTTRELLNIHYNLRRGSLKANPAASIVNSTFLNSHFKSVFMFFGLCCFIICYSFICIH